VLRKPRSIRRADQKLRGRCEAEDDEQKQAKTAQRAHRDRRLRQRALTIEGPKRI
jgi:hypothetical protein